MERGRERSYVCGSDIQAVVEQNVKFVSKGMIKRIPMKFMLYPCCIVGLV